MIKDQNEEIITDLTLVSSLLIAGYTCSKRPQWIKSPNGKETILFYFQKSDELLHDIQCFNNKSDENELFAYFGALQDVKNQLLKDVKEKAEKFVVLENDGKIAMLSENLSVEQREKLLKRFL